MDPELIYVREAVYSYAYALKAVHDELCPDQPSEFCSKMRHTGDRAYTDFLYKKLREVHYSEGMVVLPVFVA
jgi:hypothetical protein